MSCLTLTWILCRSLFQYDWFFTEEGNEDPLVSRLDLDYDQTLLGPL